MFTFIVTKEKWKYCILLIECRCPRENTRVNNNIGLRDKVMTCRLVHLSPMDPNWLCEQPQTQRHHCLCHEMQHRVRCVYLPRVSWSGQLFSQGCGWLYPLALDHPLPWKRTPIARRRHWGPLYKKFVVVVLQYILCLQKAGIHT